MLCHDLWSAGRVGFDLSLKPLLPVRGRPRLVLRFCIDYIYACLLASIAWHLPPTAQNGPACAPKCDQAQSSQSKPDYHPEPDYQSQITTMSQITLSGWKWLKVLFHPIFIAVTSLPVGKKCIVPNYICPVSYVRCWRSILRKRDQAIHKW